MMQEEQALKDPAHREPDDLRLTRIWLRSTLIEQGWTDRAIACRVRSGEWAKVRHGAYVDGAVWRSLDAAGRHEVRVRAVLMQARIELIASHTSGLLLFGAPTWGLDLRDVHVTRTDRRSGRREAGVCQHRGTLVDGDRTERHGLAVMHPTRLALETAITVDVEPALVVVNDLLHRKLTTPERLEERRGRGMERWQGSLTADVVLRLADARIESVGESRTEFMLWKHGTGIPKAEPNYEIKDGSGRVLFRVDFAWPQLGVFMEFDGKAKYLEHRRSGESVADCVWREKRRQERIEELTGWSCVRIVWGDLERPRHTVERIRSVLARAQHQAHGRAPVPAAVVPAAT